LLTEVLVATREEEIFKSQILTHESGIIAILSFLLLDTQRMTSHHIAIAKASFLGGLLRPDPTPVPRDDISAFHSSLDKALLHCSSKNIQV
jgi:hypothetical protein